MNKHIN